MKILIHSWHQPFFKLLPAWLLLVLTVTVAAQALADTDTDTASTPSLIVKIKQVNSDSPVQTVTCTLLQKNCDMPFVINPGAATERSLNIHVVYFEGGLALHFKTTGGYFYTANTVGEAVVYNALWNARFEGSAPATFTATLSQPLAPDLLAAADPDADYTPVANLEVTATPNP